MVKLVPWKEHLRYCVRRRTSELLSVFRYKVAFVLRVYRLCYLLDPVEKEVVQDRRKHLQIGSRDFIHPLWNSVVVWIPENLSNEHFGEQEEASDELNYLQIAFTKGIVLYFLCLHKDAVWVNLYAVDFEFCEQLVWDEGALVCEAGEEAGQRVWEFFGSCVRDEPFDDSLYSHLRFNHSALFLLEVGHILVHEVEV